MARMEILGMKRPLKLRWSAGDSSDGGFVEIADAENFQVAGMEARQNRWRSSDVGLKLKALIDAYNDQVVKRK